MHEILKPYVEKGLISQFKHPTRDLIGYNYSEKTQFEKAWDQYTLMCRGLILDGDGQIVARPLKKFMNWEQHEGPIPSSEPEIYEKLDGSLGIATMHKGELVFATRGSFVSEQAQWAKDHMLTYYGANWMEPGFTYCFEIIYPENRIVVDYGDTRDLVLLAKINTETGEEQHIYFGVPEWTGPRARQSIPFNPTSIEQLKAADIENHEGYVLFWRAEGLRLKLKYPSYVRLHRLLTGVNAVRIWECLRIGESLDHFIEQVPDEFYRFVTDTRDRLVGEFEQIEHVARAAYMSNGPFETRKDFAAWATTQGSVTPILFRMLDGKPYDDVIWKMIKPEAERPFRMGEAA